MTADDDGVEPTDCAAPQSKARNDAIKQALPGLQATQGQREQVIP